MSLFLSIYALSHPWSSSEHLALGFLRGFLALTILCERFSFLLGDFAFIFIRVVSFSLSLFFGSWSVSELIGLDSS